MPGKYIVIEGPDGSGKTTQSDKLLNYLQGHRKIPTTLIHQPGCTSIGTMIRQILKDPMLSIDNVCERFLFAADHADAMRYVRGLLASGYTIISDRISCVSEYPYGLARGNVSMELIEQIDSFIDTPKIDLLILLQLSPDTQKRRFALRGKKTDRIEESGNDYMTKVINFYREVPSIPRVADLCKEIVVIDADKDIETIWDHIQTHVDGLFEMGVQND